MTTTMGRTAAAASTPSPPMPTGGGGSAPTPPPANSPAASPHPQHLGTCVGPGEHAVLTADISYSRLYGGSGTYTQAGTFAFGRPAVMAGGARGHRGDQLPTQDHRRPRRRPSWRDHQRAQVIVTTPGVRHRHRHRTHLGGVHHRPAPRPDRLVTHSGLRPGLLPDVPVRAGRPGAGGVGCGRGARCAMATTRAWPPCSTNPRHRHMPR